eukprot:CAMPEP_0119565966 /NCGR_PEP_ID=MMETSP1352-20130426/31649_1 /TAXON_ID=265584 /ORGANISM="Stauroneis constricta, Strain CCMP1120" /LENGTH=86 /DNA_ID=CAMNT_0007614995 /DNA_START=121 /DNA_END=381 /DNA_ORIENTATION=+
MTIGAFFAKYYQRSAPRGGTAALSMGGRGGIDQTASKRAYGNAAATDAATKFGPTATSPVKDPTTPDRGFIYGFDDQEMLAAFFYP